MGPSGSGKTTLLSALADRIAHQPGLVADVRVNGKPRAESDWEGIHAFVQQEDAMYGSLTVRETLEYAAQLQLGRQVSRVQVQQRVDEVLHTLGLAEAQHTLVGSPFFRGISGGQKRRLSVGVEIMRYPSILFLDEPTSGLDATAAYQLVLALRNIARMGGAHSAVVADWRRAAATGDGVGGSGARRRRAHTATHRGGEGAALVSGAGAESSQRDELCAQSGGGDVAHGHVRSAVGVSRPSVFAPGQGPDPGHLQGAVLRGCLSDLHVGEHGSHVYRGAASVFAGARQRSVHRGRLADGQYGGLPASGVPALAGQFVHRVLDGGTDAPSWPLLLFHVELVPDASGGRSAHALHQHSGAHRHFGHCDGRRRLRRFHAHRRLFRGVQQHRLVGALDRLPVVAHVRIRQFHGEQLQRPDRLLVHRGRPDGAAHGRRGVKFVRHSLHQHLAQLGRTHRHDRYLPLVRLYGAAFCGHRSEVTSKEAGGGSIVATGVVGDQRRAGERVAGGGHLHAAGVESGAAARPRAAGRERAQGGGEAASGARGRQRAAPGDGAGERVAATRAGDCRWEWTSVDRVNQYVDAGHVEHSGRPARQYMPASSSLRNAAMSATNSESRGWRSADWLVGLVHDGHSRLCYSIHCTPYKLYDNEILSFPVGGVAIRAGGAGGFGRRARLGAAAAVPGGAP
eukprot:ctg_1537.g430